MKTQFSIPDDAPEFTATTALARSGLYFLFARIFRAEVDAELLTQIRDPAVVDAFADAQIDINSILPAADDQPEIDLLAQEFTRLFFGPGKHVSPHESVQLEKGGGNLWGEETGIVKRFIEAAGFDYENSFHGIPDHICVELEFLGRLASREAEASDGGDVQNVTALRQWQYKFISEHLGKWLEPFTQRLKSSASSKFYPAFAELLSEFLATESLYLESAIHEVDSARP